MSVLTSARRLLILPAFALIVPAAAALGGLAFFAWKPGVALSVLGSARAVGFAVVIGVLTVGLGWGLPRLGARPLPTMLAQAVPVVLAFVVTVLPAVLGSAVDEPLPQASGVASWAGGQDASGVASQDPSAPAASPGVVSPDVVSEGGLRGIDHEATGRVRLLLLPDGTHVVRLEGLDVEPGPDYFVHLVPGADRSEPEGGVRLDRLRASQGNQNYPVPAGTSIEEPLTVLIWCRAFAVPVAAATLA
jgi:hypothetical protein